MSSQHFLAKLYWIVIIAYIASIYIPCHGQNVTSSTTNVQTSNTPTTTAIIDEQVYHPGLVIAMVSLGFVGIILIALAGGHALYQLYNGGISSKFARFLYLTFFLGGTITCLSIALFRTDLILPMGSIISCKVGFYLMTHAIFISKLTLLAIFVVRIDESFHSSALGYPRWFLITVVIAYFLIICPLDIAHIYVSWDYVQLRDNKPLGNLEIGICSTGLVQDDQLYSLVLACLFMGDMIFNLLVCFLFIYKLHKVVAMTKSHSSKKKNGGVSPSRNDSMRENKLSKLMRKQTILVLLAVMTSLLTIGVGAISTAALLFMSVDAVFNTMCIYLMFSFSDKIWNKIMQYCCCCCRCCLEKEDFLMTMHSFSRKISMRSRTSLNPDSVSGLHSTSLSRKKSRDLEYRMASISTKDTPAHTGADSGTVPISKRVSKKNNSIHINFDNNVKPKDIAKKKKNDNLTTKKEQIGDASPRNSPLSQPITPTAETHLQELQLCTSQSSVDSEQRDESHETVETP